MSTKTILLVEVLAVWPVLAAQDTRDQELARLLATDTSQQAAVETIVASGAVKVPLLIAWTRTPPISLNEFERYIFDTGLADVFGRLKAKEAIPFLIQNIGMLRWPQNVPVWKKPPEVIEAYMPAVAALIRIGPEALNAIVEMPYGPSELNDRLAKIFVVSRIGATLQDQNRQQAREFLNSALSEANLEHFCANEGLKLLGENNH